MPDTLTVPLPPGVDPDEARLLFAAALFDQGHLTLGQAAEMVGQTRPEFIEVLNRLGVTLFQYDGDELASDLESLRPR